MPRFSGRVGDTDNFFIQGALLSALPAMYQLRPNRKNKGTARAARQLRRTTAEWRNNKTFDARRRSYRRQYPVQARQYNENYLVLKADHGYYH